MDCRFKTLVNHHSKTSQTQKTQTTPLNQVFIERLKKSNTLRERKAVTQMNFISSETASFLSAD